MKTIKVNVRKTSTYYHDEYRADCSLGQGKGREDLIDFWPTSRGWSFNTKGVLGWHGGLWDGTDVEGDEFPVEYFKRICQALWILKTNDTEFPEVEFTVGAKKLLNIK